MHWIDSPTIIHSNYYPHIFPSSPASITKTKQTHVITIVSVHSDRIFVVVRDQNTQKAQIFGRGWATEGLVGDARSHASFVPLEVPLHDVYASENTTDVEIKTVAAADFHSVLLTQSGKLYTWGSNKMHQLGRHTKFGMFFILFFLSILTKKN